MAGQRKPHRGRSKRLAQTIMRALLIDDAAKAEIADLKRRAFEDKVTLEITEGRARAYAEAGIRPREFIEQRIRIKDGFLVTFTVEEHPPGTVRHLEVGIDAAHRLPAKEACEILMKNFDFRNEFDNVLRWLDEKPGAPGRASVHLVEPLDGDIQAFLDTRNDDPYARRAG